MEQIGIMQHDMRHQLAAIKGFLGAGDIKGAKNYCDEITKAIPLDAKIVCQNFAVKTAALHYLAKAE
jgi:sensor histidine kinase regulating citrate/malate metabolism